MRRRDKEHLLIAIGHRGYNSARLNSLYQHERVWKIFAVSIHANKRNQRRLESSPYQYRRGGWSRCINTSNEEGTGCGHVGDNRRVELEVFAVPNTDEQDSFGVAEESVKRAVGNDGGPWLWLCWASG